jgi:hypothetical protein
MEYPRLGVKPGDRITLDLINGVSGITGEVAEVLEEPDGGVRQLAIRDDPSRPDPLWIRGDLIAIWRLGEAVIKRSAVPGLQVPYAVPDGMQRR